MSDINTAKLKDMLYLMDRKKREIHIIKFSANWCVHCKKIEPLWDSFTHAHPDNIIIWEVNIDDNLDLFMFMKKRRMLKGIPTILAWYPQTSRNEDTWYIPEDSVSGYDEKSISDFFDRAIHKANAL